MALENATLSRLQQAVLGPGFCMSRMSDVEVSGQGSGGNTSGLRSGDTRFESRPGHWIGSPQSLQANDGPVPSIKMQPLAFTASPYTLVTLQCYVKEECASVYPALR
jgi:hypothetical protein